VAGGGSFPDGIERGAGDAFPVEGLDNRRFAVARRLRAFPSAPYPFVELERPLWRIAYGCFGSVSVGRGCLSSANSRH